MSCSAPRLLSYYSDKVNIYDSKCFIPLPNYKTCPPPSCTWLTPGEVYFQGYSCPPLIKPLAPPLVPPGLCCGIKIEPCDDPCAANGSKNCGTKQACTPCQKGEYVKPCCEK